MLTYRKPIARNSDLKFTCGPFTIPPSAGSDNSDALAVELYESSGLRPLISKMRPKLPAQPISATKSIAHFGKPVGMSGYLDLEFPSSYYSLEDPQNHHYFLVEFPAKTFVFNPTSTREQVSCTDPTKSSRGYVASYYTSPDHSIEYLRIDFFLGTTIKHGERFVVRMRGLLTPLYASHSDAQIKIRMYDRDDQYVATETLSVVIDDAPL